MKELALLTEQKNSTVKGEKSPSIYRLLASEMRKRGNFEPPIIISRRSNNELRAKRFKPELSFAAGLLNQPSGSLALIEPKPAFPYKRLNYG